MGSDLIPYGYKIFYIVVPTVGILGNALIIYATLFSRNLRSSCNILIALISLGDILHEISFYIMIISHEIMEDHKFSPWKCLYWQTASIIGVCFASFLLLGVAFDRLLSIHPS
ncbi:hypothetical protein ANCCAN_05635 [Ancylostoma caninum]|uniref:G-protein coupled receptors family 1 profile domain-containing protein n=1 Tax=Ancylostoma caninum TaxID=29170 RepID=A0A368GVE2_ANCCA|nr:hypothetical protein ANCCAN_05635 [Ancylostoma caninum]